MCMSLRTTAQMMLLTSIVGIEIPAQNIGLVAWFNRQLSAVGCVIIGLELDCVSAGW